MTELQAWEPKPFDGEDLLPVAQTQQHVGPADVPIVEDHDMEPEDMLLPQLSVLQGTTKIVAQGTVEGATVGKLYFSGSDRVITPPARLIVIHHFRGNAMFTRDPKKNPEYEGLEDCISRNGVKGTKYGFCETCKKCTEWRGEQSDLPPLGTKTQQFVVWLDDGVGILRLSMSNKHVIKSTKTFLTRRATTGRNWFAHPTVFTVGKHTNQRDEPFAAAVLRWDETETVPDDVQRACYAWVQRIRQALELGTLSEDESGSASATPSSDAGTASDAPLPAGDIPF